jgi:hypothetical protein
VLKALLRVFHERYADEVDNELFLPTSLEVLEKGHHLLQVYLFLCWIVFSPRARALVLTQEKPAKANMFMRILKRRLLFVFHGLKPSGAFFENGAVMNILRQNDFFIVGIMQIYAHL